MTRCYGCMRRYVYATTESRAKILAAETDGGEKKYRPVSPFNSKVPTLVSLPREHGAVGWMRLFVHPIVAGAHTIELPVIMPHVVSTVRQTQQSIRNNRTENSHLKRKDSHHVSSTADIKP